MKHFIILFSLLFSFLTLSIAQLIPNGNLEVWIDSPGAWSEVPDGWSTQNYQLFQSLYKDTLACEGEYAMKLAPFSGIETIMGTSTLEFPITAIPPTLNFCVKSNIDSDGFFTDTSRVIISFWNGDNQFYSEEWINTESINEWTEISIPLSQIEPVMDACHIEVQASYPGIGLGSGSLATWIRVDDFRFEGINGIQEKVKAEFSIFPNPSNSGTFTLQSSIPIDQFTLVDLIGNVVLEQNSIRDRKLEINTNLPTGMYFLQWNGETRKIVIE